MWFFNKRACKYIQTPLDLKLQAYPGGWGVGGTTGLTGAWVTGARRLCTQERTGWVIKVGAKMMVLCVSLWNLFCCSNTFCVLDRKSETKYNLCTGHCNDDATLIIPREANIGYRVRWVVGEENHLRSTFSAPGFVLSTDKSLGISAKQWLEGSWFRADFTAKEVGSERV